MSNGLIIGVDLDNTIIDYSGAIASCSTEIGYLGIPAKESVKSWAKSQLNGELIWRRYQECLYTHGLREASVSAGFLRFCKLARYSGARIFVFSHKTEGSYSSGRPLRPAALEFLETNQLFSSHSGAFIDDVYFFDSVEDKVRAVMDSDCDVFIDDLNSVITKLQKLIKLSNQSRELKIFKYQHSQRRGAGTYCWDTLSLELFGDSFFTYFLAKPFPEHLKASEYSIERVIKGGNSFVLKLASAIGHQELALKIYPSSLDTEVTRIQREVLGCKLLQNLKIETPNLNWYSLSDGCAIFSWIKGQAPDVITTNHIDQAVEFICSLTWLSDNLSCDVPAAKGSCLSSEDIIRQIKERLETFRGELDSEFREFIYEELIPVFKKFESFAELSALKNINIPLILSPADFGFHNALETVDGRLAWIDFEYFGWDSPIKLASEFLWHPGFHLEVSQKRRWLESIKRVFSFEAFDHQFALQHPLFGIRWILIILDRAIATENSVIKREKLALSTLMLNEIKECYFG